MMGRFVLIAILAVTVIQSYGSGVQVQMPETAELVHEDDDLQTQIKDLQKNVSDIWTYIYDLRNAVSKHLTHLRTHQVSLETSVHRMEHLHDGVDESSSHSNSHHHSGEQHSHSGERHSHGSDYSHGDDHHHGSDHHHEDDHSHGGDHSHGDGHSHGGDHSHGDDHSHGGDHSHGDDHSHGGDHSHGSEHGSDHHSHSGEDHSHSGEHHSHGGNQHSHSGEHGHHSQSHSHSHTSHDHSKEDSSITHSPDSHSHGNEHDHDHKDSHETEDLTQQTQQVAVETHPVAEPVVTAINRQNHSHHYHHSHHHSQAGRSSGGISNSMDLMNEHSFHNHNHGHHRHHHHDVKSKNRTVELPKHADFNMYDFAICNVQPNRAIPQDQQQNVGGQITFWQKKSGGSLNIHVRLQGFAVGDHHGHHGAHQAVQQEMDNEAPQAAGHRHGFHIHMSGDLTNGCQSTGPHFNPKGVNHGAPDALVRHIGDLGNIECDENGVTNIIFSDDVLSLRGQYPIDGKSAVIHASTDDYGLGGDSESLKTGNSGTRIACCVIQTVSKLRMRDMNLMKQATQYSNFKKE